MARFYPSGGAGGGGIDPDELTATPAQILEGYVGGAKGYDDPVGGTMKNRNIVDPVTGGINSGFPTIATHKGKNQQISTTTNSKETLFNIQPAEGFYNGSYASIPLSDVGPAIGLSSGMLRAGYNIAGVQGDAWVQWTGDTNATPADMSEGKTAYVNGAKISGTIPWRGTGQHGVGLGWNGQGLYYHIPRGRYEEGAGNPWVYMTRAEIASIVTSAVSFRVAQYANLTMIATWARPSTGPWSGLRVMAKQGSYPANVNDGTCIYHGSGTSVTTTLAAGVWYFRAWNYLTCKDGGTIYGGYAQTTCNNAVIRGQQKFTASSGTFTVPANVRSIDIFVVGGGGGCAQDDSNPSGGGGGGYAKTYKSIAVTPGQVLNVSIGSGGVAGSVTSVGSYSAAGGQGGVPYSGASGGSGGGAPSTSESEASGGAGHGGSNGSKGGDSTDKYDRFQYSGGSGQGSSTRAFGEASGDIYSGGGGGYGYTGGGGYYTKAGWGGEGGGGDAPPQRYFGGNGGTGVANTGGGGCGLSYRQEGNSRNYRYGGSGVAIIRWGY